MRQARAAAAGTGAQLLPTADLGASATFEHQSLRGPFGSVARARPGFSRDGHDYAVGRRRAGKSISSEGCAGTAAAARAEAQAAEADQAGTRVTVAADAADAYLQIRGYQARLAVAQDQIDTDDISSPRA